MNLISKMNNRIEIWRNTQVDTDLGMTIEPELLKKVWADVIPQQSGSIANEAGNTISNTTKFRIKIIMVKNYFYLQRGFTAMDITINFFLINGLRYDIEYIIPDFNKNAYLDISAVLKGE